MAINSVLVLCLISAMVLPNKVNPECFPFCNIRHKATHHTCLIRTILILARGRSLVSCVPMRERKTMRKCTLFKLGSSAQSINTCDINRYRFNRLIIASMYVCSPLDWWSRKYVCPDRCMSVVHWIDGQGSACNLIDLCL